MLFSGLTLGTISVREGAKIHVIEWRSRTFPKDERGYVARCELWGPWAQRLAGEEVFRGVLADVTCRRCVARLTGASTPEQVDLAIAIAGAAAGRTGIRFPVNE